MTCVKLYNLMTLAQVASETENVPKEMREGLKLLS